MLVWECGWQPLPSLFSTIPAQPLCSLLTFFAKRFRLRYSSLSQLLHERDWVHCIHEEMDTFVHGSALGDQSGSNKPEAVSRVCWPK